MLKLYTDGSCSPNPGLGGWAAIFYDNNNNPEKHCGYLENTTNNVMEITAVIEGLKHIKNYTKEVEIISDSQYVINTITNRFKIFSVTEDFEFICNYYYIFVYIS